MHPKRNTRKKPRKETLPVPTSKEFPVAATGEELGEGNKTAAKRYNAGVERTMATKDVDRLADKAKKALDGPEGEELRAAEEKGKKSPVA